MKEGLGPGWGSRMEGEGEEEREGGEDEESQIPQFSV